jgi:hypothetical protein
MLCSKEITVSRRSVHVESLEVSRDQAVTWVSKHYYLYTGRRGRRKGKALGVGSAMLG